LTLGNTEADNGKMPNNPSTSSRIEALRFPLIIGVAFIHSASVLHLANGSFDVQHTNLSWVNFIVYFTQSFVDISVPIFFTISGYLFFKSEWSWGRYIDKLKRRFHTLLIPFLFWSLATLIVLAVAESIPQIRMHFAGESWPDVCSLSILGDINVIFGTFDLYPLLHPFWFLRDLMALVIFAPVFHFIFCRKWGGIFLIAIFCLLFAFMLPNLEWPILWPGLISTCYFSLGAYLSQRENSVASIDRIGPAASLIFFAGVTLNFVFPSSQSHLFSEIITALAAPGVWWLIGVIVRSTRWMTFLAGLSGDAFFVYAIHQPLLVILRKIIFQWFLPTSGTAILALYFLLPLCLIASLVVLNRLLMKFMPAFMGFITGNSYRSHLQHACNPLK